MTTEARQKLIHHLIQLLAEDGEVVLDNRQRGFHQRGYEDVPAVYRKILPNIEFGNGVIAVITHEQWQAEHGSPLRRAAIFAKRFLLDALDSTALLSRMTAQVTWGAPSFRSNRPVFIDPEMPTAITVIGEQEPCLSVDTGAIFGFGGTSDQT